MYWHNKLAASTYARNRKLYMLISAGQVTLAGYSKGKIYGMLNCASGKRMKLAHRVFFSNEVEAITMGYRPCGKCMYEKYKLWKNKS